MTVRDRIRRALLELGVVGEGQAVSAGAAADALSYFTLMLGAFSVDRLTIYQHVRTVFALIANQAAYTIGPSGATVTLARPAQIDRVGVVTGTSPDTLETPLDLLTADQWASIGAKEQTGTQPQAAWYHPTHPSGTLNVWPIPTDATVSLAIYVPTPISAAGLTLNTDLIVPDPYDEFLHYQLVKRLATPFARPLSADTRRLAEESRLRVEGSNVEVGKLTSDPGLLNAPGGGYNILTGGWR